MRTACLCLLLLQGCSLIGGFDDFTFDGTDHDAQSSSDGGTEDAAELDAGDASIVEVLDASSDASDAETSEVLDASSDAGDASNELDASPILDADTHDAELDADASDGATVPVDSCCGMWCPGRCAGVAVVCWNGSEYRCAASCSRDCPEP